MQRAPAERGVAALDGRLTEILLARPRRSRLFASSVWERARLPVRSVDHSKTAFLHFRSRAFRPFSERRDLSGKLLARLARCVRSRPELLLLMLGSHTGMRLASRLLLEDAGQTHSIEPPFRASVRRTLVRGGTRTRVAARLGLLSGSLLSVSPRFAALVEVPETAAGAAVWYGIERALARRPDRSAVLGDRLAGENANTASLARWVAGRGVEPSPIWRAVSRALARSPAFAAGFLSELCKNEPRIVRALLNVRDARSSAIAGAVGGLLADGRASSPALDVVTEELREQELVGSALAGAEVARRQQARLGEGGGLLWKTPLAPLSRAAERSLAFREALENQFLALAREPLRLACWVRRDPEAIIDAVERFPALSLSLIATESGRHAVQATPFGRAALARALTHLPSTSTARQLGWPRQRQLLANLVQGASALDDLPHGFLAPGLRHVIPGPQLPHDFASYAARGVRERTGRWATPPPVLTVPPGAPLRSQVHMGRTGVPDNGHPRAAGYGARKSRPLKIVSHGSALPIRHPVAARHPQRSSEVRSAITRSHELTAHPKFPSGLSHQSADGFRHALIHAGGAGHRIAPEHRTPLEDFFGRDLTDVRVHSGGTAATAAEQLQADAFTIGRDIFFGQGRMAPGTAAGQALLAHELTHVVQQTGQGAQLHGYGSAPQTLEAEARHVERVFRSHSEGTGAGLLVGRYERTYVNVGQVPLSTFEQERLERISTQALHICGKLLEQDGRFAGEHHLARVELELDLDLSRMSEAEAADQWARELLRAIARQLSSTVRPRSRASVGRKTSSTAPSRSRDADQELILRSPNGQPSPEPGPTPVAPKTAPPPPAPSATPKPQPGPRPECAEGPPDALVTAFRQKYGPLAPEDEECAAPPSRMEMALRIAPNYMGAGIRDQARATFTSPSFYLITALALGAYLGLWLVPEPFFTKAAAAAMTVGLAMTVSFGIAEIRNLASAWMRLEEEAGAATTLDQVEGAAASFGHSLGQTEFDLLLALAMYFGGKALPAPKPRVPNEIGLQDGSKLVRNAKGKGVRWAPADEGGQLPPDGHSEPPGKPHSLPEDPKPAAGPEDEGARPNPRDRATTSEQYRRVRSWQRRMRRTGGKVVSPSRLHHILEGEGVGTGSGGHGQGRATPGKSEFPIPDDEVRQLVADLATDPSSTPMYAGKGPRSTGGHPRFRIEGIRTVSTGQKLRIRVIIEPEGEGVITAFPVDVPRNP